MEKFQEGDLVVLIPAFKSKKKRRFVIKLRKGSKTHTNYGSFDHDYILNISPGDVVETNTGFKFYALKATLTDAIFHFSEFRYATQIIYPRDWGLILSFADIKNGSKVVEIGTGSGAFTAFLVFRVGERGFVYSYERDPERAEIARKNLEKLCVPKRYVIKVKDVARDGIDENNVDIVFADIPEPWTIISHAYNALKPSGFFVAYIPTYNQIEKTLLELERFPFVDVRIIEGFVRDIQPKHYAIRPELKGYFFSAYILFARKVLRKIQ